MSIPNYRVVLSFDAERKVFSARAPELEHCAAEGATRGEAIAKLEKEIEAQLQNMQERSHRPPTAVDETTFSGEMQIRVSRTLHRDLTWQARSEGIELDQLLSELLMSGLDGRRHVSRPPRGNRAHQGEMHDNAGNQRDHQDRPRQNYGSRYNPGILEDRANFIEYVRGLETDSGSQRGPNGRGGPRGGGGPGPGGGGGGGPGGGGPGADRSGDRGGDGRGGRRRGRGRGPGGPQRVGPGGPQSSQPAQSPPNREPAQQSSTAPAASEGGGGTGAANPASTPGTGGSTPGSSGQT